MRWIGHWDSETEGAGEAKGGQGNLAPYPITVTSELCTDEELRCLWVWGEREAGWATPPPGIEIEGNQVEEVVPPSSRQN